MINQMYSRINTEVLELTLMYNYINCTSFPEHDKNYE